MPRLERCISIAGVVTLGALLLGACGDELSVGQDFAAGGAGGSGGTLGGFGGLPGDGQAGAPPTCTIVKCRDNNTYDCGDCIDNDDDGRIDAADPLCLGPCDNTENSFHDGRIDQMGARCRQDCYFDRDTGPGNDGCNWSHQCDPLSVPDDYPPSGDARCVYDPAARIPGTELRCADVAPGQADAGGQTSACLDTCIPLTPNGCDCFGCCELPAGSGQHVYLGSSRDGRGSCDPSVIDDPERCRRCTPVLQCYNRCGACEFCVGRPEPAPSCSNGSGRCPSGVAPCDAATGISCGPRHYCVTGCCVQIAF